MPRAPDDLGAVENSVQEDVKDSGVEGPTAWGEEAAGEVAAGEAAGSTEAPSDGILDPAEANAEALDGNATAAKTDGENAGARSCRTRRRV